jgi:limonene-1,2-epoxide hydrolase
VVLDGSAEANDRLVRRFRSAWERRDADFIIGCLSDDAVYHSIPLSPIVGKQAVAAWVRGFAGKPPGRLEVRHQVAASDVVMNERTDVIVLNGRTVTLPICAVFELRDGRIRAWREYFDLAPAAAAYRESPAPD